ncbi:MAG: hypothetical protein WC467_00080 [Patescibacteria group bacterium]
MNTELDVIEANIDTEIAEENEINSIPDWEETMDIIEVAEEAAENWAKEINRKRKEEGKPEIAIPFSRSYSEELISQENVKISLPSSGAKFLSPISGHQIIAFQSESLDGLTHLEIPAHYQNGDMTTRNANGSLRPTVARHFFIGPEYFGSFIIAKVTITKKTEILSGRQMLNINIDPVRKSGKVAVLRNNYLRKGEDIPMVKKPDGTEEPAQIAIADYELKLGVTKNGSQFEVAIPESEKFVRFEPINPLRIIV